MAPKSKAKAKTAALAAPQAASLVPPLPGWIPFDSRNYPGSSESDLKKMREFHNDIQDFEKMKNLENKNKEKKKKEQEKKEKEEKKNWKEKTK